MTLPFGRRAPVSLAQPLRFDASDVSHFGAPRAGRMPLALPGFSGTVAGGASCNCDILTLAPHCHGTHTEGVGHLLAEPLDVHDVAPLDPRPAWLLTVTAERADATGEHGRPRPRAGDRLVTRRALADALARLDPSTHGPADEAEACVIRCHDPAVDSRPDAAGAAPPPYLSLQAAAWLVEHGIRHLVVELPSIDRLADDGELGAHRLFFGLPPRTPGAPTPRLAEAEPERRGCTVTELARIPAGLADGSGWLQLTLPAIAGDAVPSRPLWWAATPVGRP